MKFLFKKKYTILFFIIILLFGFNVFAKETEIKYKKKNISNYFLGIISANQGENDKAFKHLEKVQLLKNRHSKFNIEFIRTLVLVEKFDQAINFSKKIWNENEFLFEADLLIGLDYLIKKNYIGAEKHFDRLNAISRHNLFFEDFIGNILIAWSKAASGKKKESFEFLKKIPSPYNHITNIQNTFLHCKFDSSKTPFLFAGLIQNKDYNFSRYNFFFVNYFLHKEKIIEAKKLILESRKKNSSNLLLKQTENFMLNNDILEIKNFFNCNEPKDSIAEFFYILANLYATEKDYQLSNFYLKISLFLNKKFLPNQSLLAENYYYQKKYESSKNAYLSVKSIGSVYSWYVAKSISTILLHTKGKKYSFKKIQKEFNKLKNVNFEHYYELANFYKDNEEYNKAIKYYSLAIKNLKEDHPLFPKILDRRGTSYERLDQWDKAEKDLTLSLEILPNQAHVLNYLAYSWIDQGVNLEKGLQMLKKANSLRQDDGYIIDSLGWAYYAKKDYIKAEKFLQRAVELLPTDPIINDHYADTLWMLKKNIQARYFWNHILNLNETEQKLKETINRKLIFGIDEKL